MALYHFSAKALSRGSRNTVGAIAYRAGCKLYDERTGESFDYRHKHVEHVELLLPQDAPPWAVELQKLISTDRGKGVQAWCDIAEAAEKRVDARVWKEFEFALHRELTKEQNMALAREFVQDQICSHGITAQLNFHFDCDEKTGNETPHCHVTMATRRLDEEGMNPGMNPKKEEAWNKKELLLDLRVRWEEYSNFHLKLHGHDVRIDHRSNKERGIELEPQPKIGKGILEQERRAKYKAFQGQNKETETKTKTKTDPLKLREPPFVTDKMQAFHDCQLRNLYRIMRRPEAVLEIVSKHNSTFMWADIQKVLHRYVDELPLFQKLEAKLKNSNELILLRPEEREVGENVKVSSAIYTTRTLLKAEKSLVETADRLDQSKSHGVQDHHIEVAIEGANEKLKKHGGLSEDQTKAIHHLVDNGQIKCVVGIAGAGKTTALGVCHDIWKAEGYAVYGLAPTGKAAQNLEQGGISSTTLHKFLKSFEEGRCQYSQNSVLVLDEAGMVDIERFEKLLSAVNHLGIKLIVVGDGAQLQPVEAGPAFRLVTTRLGKVELNTVLRQKEEWQQEATVLFGRQETREAIQKYMDKGHVHIVEEKLPSLSDLITNGDREGIVKLYEVSSRTSSLIYREMMKDVKEINPQGTSTFALTKQHQDFGRYMEWKNLQKGSAAKILKGGEDYHPHLEARSIDPTKMALLFVDKKLDKAAQQQEVMALLKKGGLESLVGIEKKPGQGIDVRQNTKDALIRAWHEGIKASETQSLKTQSLKTQSPKDSSSPKHALMLSFSNRDTNDLNRTARALLKDSGNISKEDFTYTVSKRVEDDFGVEHIFTESKNFSKGDRVVFTQNDTGLGVKNGSMGTITDLNRQKMRVKLDEGEEISFAPKLNPYFDQGWAITIHKSQGTTVDNTYLLASYEMTQNLAYVAMTRHRDNVHVFGSQLDFWRPSILPEVLSKSGEKLSAADYLDADSLNKLMQQDDRLLTKIFERVSNELDAMGAVSKRAFWQVADHFLGVERKQEIRVTPDHTQSSIREEVRAEELLQQKEGRPPESILSFSQDLKRVHERGQGQESSEEKLQTKTETSKPQKPRPLIGAGLVEAALKQNMASFADDIFSSIGEPYNAPSSSSTERRYGKNGHIAVNLETGAWIDHKDSDKSGGPIHMLTKLKGLNFKEAVEYGAAWAGLSQTKLSQIELSETGLSGDRLSQTGIERSAFKVLASVPQQDEQKELNEERKTKIDKAKALWDKGLPIQGTLAERYLREHRKIQGPLSEGSLLKGDLSENLRYLPSFRDANSKQSFPSLMAGARSQSGELTAVQITFLNPETAAKVDLMVAKRSFGIIKGSTVTLQDSRSDDLLSESSLREYSLRKESPLSNVLFIAEGIETALSLKSAGIQGTIKASLGLSNIKRILPESPNTHMVICADHDAPDSPAAKSLEKSVVALKEYGLTVTVIKPDKLGDDFNDVLKNKGPQGVRDILTSSLPKDLIKSIQLEKDSSSLMMAEQPNTDAKSFQHIVGLCEKRLSQFLERQDMDLTPERSRRISLQAERMATFILHTQGEKGNMPTEVEMGNISMRAKHELDRIPEIQQDLMDEGEENPFRAYRIAERLASIEGRLTYEAMSRGIEPPLHLSYVAKKELAQNREQLPHLREDLAKRYSLSETAAQNCAQDILRYRETHGDNPSPDQMAKLVQISQKLEYKEYKHLVSSRDVAEIEFLRRREGDLLFKNGISHDASVDLDQSRSQVQKSFELVQRQMRQEQEHMIPNHDQTSNL